MNVRVSLASTEENVRIKLQASSALVPLAIAEFIASQVCIRYFAQAVKMCGAVV